MKPIFIGGCGRSGTTMLGDILGRIEGFLTTPESHFKVNAYYAAMNGDGHVDINKAVKVILGSYQSLIWGINHSDNDHAQLNSCGSYVELINNIVKSYGEGFSKKCYTHWVDHTPSNLSSALLLNKLYPEAKFIHIVRDGRAVANSVIPLDWGPNT
ncbi:MAG: sulfotransferase, partial [Cyclobacteriaceae bacterium]